MDSFCALPIDFLAGQEMKVNFLSHFLTKGSPVFDSFECFVGKGELLIN